MCIPGERNDQCELGRLLQLILGCAVNCTEKQEYIQRIMAMQESVQHAVMTAIQEVGFTDTAEVDNVKGFIYSLFKYNFIFSQELLSVHVH